MTYFSLLLLAAVACAAQPRSVIVLPAGSAVDPGNRIATILDIETWKPIGSSAVGIEAFNAFTLPDRSKTYVVSRSVTNTVTVLGELSGGGKVLKSIDLPTGLTDAALTPDGKRLLIVSMTDAALTVFNTATDRVIARVPLAAPANSVAVHFDSTHAFVASPKGGQITSINLGGNLEFDFSSDRTVTWRNFEANTVLGTRSLGTDIPIGNGLVFAPNGLLYIIAGDRLREIHPGSQMTTGSGIEAKGMEGRPHFLFDGSQALTVGRGGLSLSTLRKVRVEGSYAKPGVLFDQVRILSEFRAIGYSMNSQTFYRIDLKPSLDVSPIVSLAEVASQKVTGISSTSEDPQNRYLFLSSGKRVYRVDPKSYVITATHALEHDAGIAVAPTMPSRSPVARVAVIDPRHDSAIPVVARTLDVDGLPVQSALVTVGEFGGDSGGIRRLASNADGYVYRTDSFGGYEVYADSTSSARFGGEYDLLYRFLSASLLQVPSVPTTFRILKGNGQIVDSGNEAPDPLQVQLLDQNELPMPDVSVHWTLTLGGGQVKSSQTVTDSRGIATNLFIGAVRPAGSGPALSSILVSTARVPIVSFSMVTLPSRSSPPLPVRLRPAQGRVISATAGSVTTELTYQLPPGLRGASLEVRGSGKKQNVRCQNSPLIGDDGVATCHLFVGHGATWAKVYIGGREVEDLPINVKAGSPAVVRPFPMPQGWGRSYVSRATPLVAIVEDRYGNPVNGTSVSWDSGSAQIGDSDSLSGPGEYPDPDRPGVSIPTDGIVSNRGGVNGTVRLSIAEGHPIFLSGITFSIVDPIMIKTDGDGQSTEVGEDFVRPLVVQLRGETLVPLRSYPVSVVGAGGLVITPMVAFADAQGRVELNARAGTSIGKHVVTVFAGSQRTSFELTVTPKSETSGGTTHERPALKDLHR